MVVWPADLLRRAGRYCTIRADGCAAPRWTIEWTPCRPIGKWPSPGSWTATASPTTSSRLSTGGTPLVSLNSRSPGSVPPGSIVSKVLINYFVEASDQYRSNPVQNDQLTPIIIIIIIIIITITVTIIVLFLFKKKREEKTTSKFHQSLTAYSLGDIYWFIAKLDLSFIGFFSLFLS